MLSPSSAKSFRRGVLVPVVVMVLAACASTPRPSATAPSSSPAPSSASPIVASPSRSSAASSADGSAEPSPSGVPPRTEFVAVIDNTWFPLKPGMTWTYRGTRDGEKAEDTVTVTTKTKSIDGVVCVVVRDTLTLDGVLAERTDDYYAQHRAGNVWYFGEDTAELDTAGNVISNEGTWASGVDGAVAGLFMPADPQIGKSYAQEYYPSHAEDHFVVLLTNVAVKVPAGSYSDAVQTLEWTPLEPDILSEKSYVEGIGEVRELDVVGGDERLELVASEQR
jgi:hypothetical protein